MRATGAPRSPAHGPMPVPPWLLRVATRQLARVGSSFSSRRMSQFAVIARVGGPIAHQSCPGLSNALRNSTGPYWFRLARHVR